MPFFKKGPRTHQKRKFSKITISSVLLCHTEATEDDGNLTVNDSEKVKVLSDFFKSVYTNEDTSSIPDFKKRTENVLSYVNVTQDDILLALKSLNINKSTGPDGVHPRVLKECAEELAYPLKRLFDRTMREGRIPKK